MQAQYVHAAPEALFRIVRHGHRWRAMRDGQEIGRFASADEAVQYLRDAQLAVRLPRRLTDWRFIPAPALAHLAPPSAATMARLASAA